MRVRTHAPREKGQRMKRHVKGSPEALAEALCMLGLEGEHAEEAAARKPLRVVSFEPNEEDLERFLRGEPGWTKLWIYGGEHGTARLSVVPGLYHVHAEMRGGRRQHREYDTKGIMNALQWVRRTAGEPK
jgi:hypothetical protein